MLNPLDKFHICLKHFKCIWRSISYHMQSLYKSAIQFVQKYKNLWPWLCVCVLCTEKWQFLFVFQWNLQRPQCHLESGLVHYAFNCRKCIIMREDKAAFCLTRCDILPTLYTYPARVLYTTSLMSYIMCCLTFFYMVLLCMLYLSLLLHITILHGVHNSPG